MRAKITWQGVDIPTSLEPISGPTKDRLWLRFSSPEIRREWELYFFLSRSPKRLSGSLFIVPWDWRDHRRVPFTESQRVAREQKLRGWFFDCGIEWYSLTVSDGKLLLRAVLADLDSLANTHTIKQTFDRSAGGSDDGR